MGPWLADTYDPLRHLSYFQRVRADYNIQSNTITPFDQSSYIQVMFNP